MKQKKQKPTRHEPFLYWLTVIAAVCAANSYPYLQDRPSGNTAALLLALAANLLPLFSLRKYPDLKTRLCSHGSVCLRVFRLSAVIGLVHHLATFRLIPTLPVSWLPSLLRYIIVETVLYWNGLICAYSGSCQLGVSAKAAAMFLGRIPIVRPLMLNRIIRVTMEEVDFEVSKHMLNLSRRERKICATRYPILLVHGVFFRDSMQNNYWNRIPGELERNGATVFYGDHQSANTVHGSGQEIARRIREICRSTGCEKVNIIAHSKGGLDCRSAISDPETAKLVASLTTISTPHRGCQFADYLLTKVPGAAQQKIADSYNTAAMKKGDYAPDFMGAVRDLTASFCEDFDCHTPPPPGVFCQSVGSRLNRVIDGAFPLNFCSQLVKFFDGANDGLVGETAFQWGEKFTFLSTESSRGISHGDVVDQNKENIPGFDVREFYVQLVADLKNRGY